MTAIRKRIENKTKSLIHWIEYTKQKIQANRSEYRLQTLYKGGAYMKNIKLIACTGIKQKGLNDFNQ